jgi:hypothetical protein
MQLSQARNIGLAQLVEKYSHGLGPNGRLGADPPGIRHGG